MPITFGNIPEPEGGWASLNPFNDPSYAGESSFQGALPAPEGAPPAPPAPIAPGFPSAGSPAPPTPAAVENPRNPTTGLHEITSGGKRYQMPVWPGNPQDFYRAFLSANQLRPSRADRASLQPFVDALNMFWTPGGHRSELYFDPTRPEKGVRGLMNNGQFIKLLDSTNNPIWDIGEQGGGGGSAQALSAPTPVSSYMAQFNDPSTKLLEQLLTQQMGILSGQQAAQEKANVDLRARMTSAKAASDRLIAYLNQRATQLQAAPYTGAEQEVFRTQALNPIEADRTAANRRALQQISARGLTPESGISQELMNQVNNVFDRARADAQGELAYRTINEQRSRQQEAQQLLGLIPEVERAGVSGDLSLLQALNAAANQPAQQAIGLATANQRLPSMALNDALGVMGMAGSSPDSVFQQAMNLYAMQNQRAQQGLGYSQMLGAALPYLMGFGGRGR